jgi:hypothetical protein
MPTLTDNGNLLTLDMLLEQIPALGERTVKHWLQRNPDHFREMCVVTIGRKLYFDLAAMERWLLDHRGRATRKG